MAVEQVAFRNHLLTRDDVLTWRWFDAFGPSAVKHIENFVAWSTDDTTGDPVEYTQTVVEAGGGDSTAVLTNAVGGAMIMTSAANEDDGVQLQLKNSESYQLNGLFNCYFGINFQAVDVDQSDYLVGLAITDTTAIGGLTDGAYFRSVDAVATVQFVLEKDSLETSNSVATMADATNVTLEFFWDGINITAYVDGVQQAQVATTDTNFPNDEALTPTLAFLTGEAIANTMTVNWARWIQIRE